MIRVLSAARKHLWLALNERPNSTKAWADKTIIGEASFYDDENHLDDPGVGVQDIVLDEYNAGINWAELSHDHHDYNKLGRLFGVTGGVPVHTHAKYRWRRKGGTQWSPWLDAGRKADVGQGLADNRSSRRFIDFHYTTAKRDGWRKHGLVEVEVLIYAPRRILQLAGYLGKGK